MKRLAMLFFLLVGTAGALHAQVSRATLTGRVADQSGAVVPNVQITVTDTATGAQSKTTSGTDGYYTVPFLEPGPYKVIAEAPGFKRYRHTGIDLQTEQHVMENITMQLGSTSQTVRVSANAALIDTETASAGQVLTSEEIETLPSDGRSPIGFVRIEYGVVPKQKHLLTEVRPFDNGGGSDFAMGGGNSQSNEILMNGVPNMESSDRVSAFSPELDSVNQIAADDFESSAAYGDTSNGIVNITTKNGTNQFHGTMSEFNETNALAARLYFQKPSATIPATRQNQYGLTIGGPVLIPKLYNGRNKLFFFYAFEGFNDSSPSSKITTVPTAQEKTGNFSALLGLGSSYQLYNPYAATLVNGKVVRQPYVGNIITTPLSPVGQAMVDFYPSPNQPGAADGENNYFSNTPNVDNYYSNMGRMDFNFSTSNKIFFEAHESSVVSTGGNLFHNIATGNISNTDLSGATLDDVETFSPTLSLENRLGYTRSWATNALPSTGYNPTQLGFPSYIASNSHYLALPQMYLSGYNELGGTSGGVTSFTSIQYFGELTKVWNRQTIEIGPDIRAYKTATNNPGYASGLYLFTSEWTNAYTGANAPQFGSGLAELLLGLPDTGSNQYSVNDPNLSSSYYFGGYIQDNWHVKSNLTVNLGLRVEHETPLVESQNRMNVGFDPTAVNEVTNPAEAAYAANPIPQLPVAQFQPTGGLLFATSSHRSAYQTQTAYVSPRFGIAWSPDFLHGKTVFRGGYGLFYNPFTDYYTGPTAGFQINNPMVPTRNNYLSPDATLSDPFPADNPIQQPTGSSLGYNTFLGQGITFYTPNVKAGYSSRISLDVQQQLGRNMMFDLGYISNTQHDLSTSNNDGALPISYLSTLGKYDPTVTSELSHIVPSPYAGLGAHYGNTTSVAGLLRPYSEFSAVEQELIPNGYSKYNALLARLTQRFSNGLQYNANFEWSRQLEASSQLNPGGPLWYGESSSDFPIHFVLSGTYNLPFGRGTKFFSNVNRAENLLVGGWEISSIYTWNSGTPVGWGNPIIDWSAPINSQPRNLKQAFNVNAFDRVNKDQMNGYNYRTFPEMFLRSDATNNADLSAFKNFEFGQGRQLQYRFDAFNALNRAQFGSPNTNPTSSAFGVITSQANVSRVIQMGLRISF